MVVESLNVKNFRNIKEIEIFPGENINFLIGENAQGKTNLIESIYLTAFLKSFRTNNVSEVVKQGENFSIINLNLNNNNVKNSILLKVEKNKKFILVNKKNPFKNDYFKILNVIIFHPEEVNLISSNPSFRRNLIDRSIFYENFKYIDIYKKYYKCLKQRNFNLKQKYKEVECWEEQLIEYGANIVFERNKYLEIINTIFKEKIFYKVNNENYKIVYSFKYEKLDEIKKELKNCFLKNREKEKIIGYTLVGPHRDNIEFYIDEKPANIYGSQGQKRSIIISFKTAQILNYKRTHGYAPILILDDMTSELDSNRKNILLENLLHNSGQVFITGTDIKQINHSDLTKVFRVKSGEIKLVN